MFDKVILISLALPFLMALAVNLVINKYRIIYRLQRRYRGNLTRRKNDNIKSKTTITC